MAIPAGITMVAGGGFHGKSTLLDALAVGCYNHIPGDGREFVVTSPKIVSVQGEDGRSVTNVDISPFINNLPGGVSTRSFSTQDASGSTSMAAGVVEALELGADTLLFDEDTCATNFLIRDARMQKLIRADPITPLIFKVRALFREHHCSSILVIGGCGDYCDVADLVLEMRDYKCYNVTEEARRISKDFPSVVNVHEGKSVEEEFGQVRPRIIVPYSLPGANAKVTSRRRTTIDIGAESLDLAKLSQLVHDSQTRAIASALKFCARSTGPKGLAALLQELERALDREGLAPLMASDATEFFLARPRSLEVGMAINRLRSVSLSYGDAI
ncbi:hypothetical protein NM688_g8652 [Phlebia brevispora]|uniref:Uncharacterized protein n=1 Tax=Phlebia brevispora TaxID=194682 RepID=A0ACC1RQM4_9APHY|nr:hypothetical protein NM688_g8652 [Phlebia brevispora]